MNKYDTRTAKIKRKYGADAFKRFGKMGGSPILKLWKQGKLKRVS